MEKAYFLVSVALALGGIAVTIASTQDQRWITRATWLPRLLFIGAAVFLLLALWTMWGLPPTFVGAAAIILLALGTWPPFRAFVHGVVTRLRTPAPTLAPQPAFAKARMYHMVRNSFLPLSHREKMALRIIAQGVGISAEGLSRQLAGYKFSEPQAAAEELLGKNLVRRDSSGVLSLDPSVVEFIDQLLQECDL